MQPRQCAVPFLRKNRFWVQNLMTIRRKTDRAKISKSVKTIEQLKYVSVDGVHQTSRHVGVPLSRPRIPVDKICEKRQVRLVLGCKIRNDVLGFVTNENKFKRTSDCDTIRQRRRDLCPGVLAPSAKRELPARMRVFQPLTPHRQYHLVRRGRNVNLSMRY